MHIARSDRVQMQREFLRLLLTLKLDPARSAVIWSFVQTYLKLTAEETRRYEREVAKLTPQEQETAMEIMTSWRREGMTVGRQEGKEELVVRQIQRRFGAVPAQVAGQLGRLSSEQLNDLGEALIDFGTPADLDVWLLRNSPQ